PWGRGPPGPTPPPPRLPSSVPASTCSRSRSPVDRWGTPRWAARTGPWVPLPDPGGPTSTRRTAASMPGAGRTLARVGVRSPSCGASDVVRRIPLRVLGLPAPVVCGHVVEGAGGLPPEQLVGEGGV